VWCEQNRRSWSLCLRRRDERSCVPVHSYFKQFVYSGRVPRVVNGLDAEVGPIGRSLWSLGLIKLGRKPMTLEPCRCLSPAAWRRTQQQLVISWDKAYAN
jgi:hypothetical protein